MPTTTTATMPNPNLRRSKEAAAAMPRRRNKPDGQCRKHPKHLQSPGVCSLCLCEKLSQLSRTSLRTTTSTGTKYYSSSSSSLSYYSSSSCSSCSSPMHPFGYGKTEGMGSLRLLFLSGKNIVLTKSRSLASVTRMRGNKNNRENIGDDDKKKTGGRFWSKLVRPRSNKRFEEGLVHSTSTRERVIIAAH